MTNKTYCFSPLNILLKSGPAFVTSGRTHIKVVFGCRPRSEYVVKQDKRRKFVLMAKNGVGTRFKWSSQFPWWRRLTGALSEVGETYNARLPHTPREPTHEKWRLFAPRRREVEWSCPTGGDNDVGSIRLAQGMWRISPGICNSLTHKLPSLWLLQKKIHSCYTE